MEPTTALAIAVAKALGLTPSKVTGFLRTTYGTSDADFRRLRTQTRKNKRAEIFQRELHSSLIDYYYPDSDLLAAGLSRVRFTVNDGQPISLCLATSRAWTGIHASLKGDCVKYSLVAETDCPAVIARDEDESIRIMSNFIADGREIFNEPLFRLLRLEIKAKQSHVRFGESDFIRHITTNGGLEDELFQALVDSDLDPARAYHDRDKLMPDRARFLPTAASVIDFVGRLCAGGITVLTAFARPQPENDFVFYVKRRTDKVAAGSGQMSLVPMGYHQPAVPVDTLKQARLESTVYREIFEELFEGKQLTAQDPHVAFDWYMSDQHPEMKWFADNPGHFYIEMVGFAPSLILGDYNAAILVAVQNLDYWGKFGAKIVGNWEHDTKSIAKISSKDPEAIAALLQDHTFVDSGRFTLINALRRLQHLEPSRVKLPKLKDVT